VDPNGCFLAGTLVNTPSGVAPVETVWKGDKVFSRNEAAGEVGYKTVVQTFSGHTSTVLNVKIAKASSTQRGRSESHRVGEASGGSEESDEPPLPDDTQTLRCTTEHPFWVVGQGWVAAKDLRVGQRGLDAEGNEVVYVGVEVRQEEADHYNFEVEDWHTYFVSERADAPAVWVHNDCKPCERGHAALQGAGQLRAVRRREGGSGRQDPPARLQGTRIPAGLLLGVKLS
jgi:hypothetical protein